LNGLNDLNRTLNIERPLAGERFKRSEAVEPFDRLRAGSWNDWNGPQDTGGSNFAAESEALRAENTISWDENPEITET
jgi:hypothetical protein